MLKGEKMTLFKIFVLSCIGLLLFLFASQVTADSIENYLVPTSVPLNTNITIYGDYVNAGGTIDGILCAFYIFDIENTDVNKAVIRLTDQYTFTDGSVYTEFQLTEPVFRRGIDYNAVTKCGTTEIGQTFQVTQKEDIVFGITEEMIQKDLRFWIDPENSLTVVLLLGFIIVALAITSPLWIWIFSKS